MRKIVTVFFVVLALVISALWLPNFFEEAYYFGVFNKEHGLLSGNYPFHFWALTIGSFVMLFFSLRWIYFFVKSKIKK